MFLFMNKYPHLSSILLSLIEKKYRWELRKKLNAKETTTSHEVLNLTVLNFALILPNLGQYSSRLNLYYFSRKVSRSDNFVAKVGEFHPF